MFTIYILTFSNGKKYVGQTSRSLKVRMQAHKRHVATGSTLPVHCAWRVLGEPMIDSFEVESQDALHDREIQIIKGLDCRLPNGYNVTHGGDTAPSKTPEVAAKIAAKALGRVDSPLTTVARREATKKLWSNSDYRAKVSAGVASSWTPEKRQSAADRARLLHTGKKRSEETVEKLRGRKFGDETRSKMSESAKTRKREPWSEDYKKGSAERASAQHAARAIAKGETPMPRGVSKNGTGFSARIRIDGNVKCLGTFKTPEQAHAAYLNASKLTERNHHGKH